MVVALVGVGSLPRVIPIVSSVIVAVFVLVAPKINILMRMVDFSEPSVMGQGLLLMVGISHTLAIKGVVQLVASLMFVLLIVEVVQSPALLRLGLQI